MSDTTLELALADLGSALWFPPTPSLSRSVAAAIRSAPPSAGWSWSWPRSFRRSVVLAAAALVVGAGVVGAIGLGTGAIRIRFTAATPLPSAVVSARDFGTEVSLDQARAEVAFPLVLPASPFKAPEHVFVADYPSGGTATLAWGEQAGYPAAADGIGLVVTEFRADIDPGVFEKMVHEGTTVLVTQVNGEQAWWVSGGQHFFFYTDADGHPVDTTVRLVGNVLFWEDGGLTFRVEGAPDLDAALAVAEALSAD